MLSLRMWWERWKLFRCRKWGHKPKLSGRTKDGVHFRNGIECARCGLWIQDVGRSHTLGSYVGPFPDGAEKILDEADKDPTKETS